MSFDSFGGVDEKFIGLSCLDVEVIVGGLLCCALILHLLLLIAK